MMHDMFFILVLIQIIQNKYSKNSGRVKCVAISFLCEKHGTERVRRKMSTIT